MTEAKSYRLYLPFGSKLFLFGTLFAFLGMLVVFFALPLVTPEANSPPAFVGLFVLAIVGWNLFWILRFPYEILLYSDGTICFKGVIRKVQMHATEMKSLKPANGTFGFLVVRGKKNVLLLAQFDNFHEFVSRVKQYNPSMITRGC